MTEALAAFHFIRPIWLLALLPALALFWLARRFADPAAPWRAVIDAELLPYLLVGSEARSRFGPSAWFLGGLLVATVAVGGPTWRREPSPFADAKPPVMVVLEVTPSMQASDVAPTRLQRATQKLSDLLALREGAATGLVAYAGSPHLVLPPTADSGVVLTMAKALSPDIMPKPGNDLSAAISMAQRVLADGATGGSVLVVADGGPPGEATAPADGARGAPVVFLAALPPDRPPPDQTLDDASRRLDARLVALTVDQSDVREIAGLLDTVGRLRDVEGEGQHWMEAGYWLTPLLALLTLAWFRRGWILP